MIFDPDMTSVKPYFIQALHEWISDNGLTPLAVIDAAYEGIRVPEGAIEDGKIVLNISYDAAENLQMDDELLTFNARFSGVSHAIIVPMEAVSAIYARENGKGMMFDVEHEDFNDNENAANSKQESSSKKTSSSKSKSATTNSKNKASKKSHLKLVD